jgi:hypothetical protein
MPPCPGCGLDLGAEACRSLFDELGALAWTDVRYAREQRKTVDAYALQHDEYIESAKSLMAHLGGLCCAFDYHSDPAAYDALLKSLNGSPELQKPLLPSFRGAVTIAEVMLPHNPETHAEAVDRWARSAWEAYASLHSFARQWIEKAMQSRR